MAAAEARAAWQRTANRCFVQEDAKRAPKLACCQSSSSTPKQVDSSPTSSVDGPDMPPVSSMPLAKDVTYLNIPPDTRWWLHFQPVYGHPKGLKSEEFSMSDSEIEALVTGGADSISGPCGAHMREDSDSVVLVNSDDSVYNSKFNSNASANCMKTDQEFEMLGQKALHCRNTLDNKLKDVKEQYDVADKNLDECKISKQMDERELDSESSWILCEKTEPWWRTTDVNELASWVAQKSLDHLENCDLPPPQKHVTRESYASLAVSKHDGAVPAPLSQKGLSTTVLNSNAYGQTSPTATGTNGRQLLSFDDTLPSNFQKSFSSSETNEDKIDPLNVPESDVSKAQLLEALCHSQTRAREAEKAAKQAFVEKECILSLVFRQASQLFAYKQWLRILQLEYLYAQMKTNDRPISTLFPVVLPWMPYRGKKLKTNWQKGHKGKQKKKSRPRGDSGTYGTAFTLGLGLVGAGVFLGWTVGWMYHMF